MPGCVSLIIISTSTWPWSRWDICSERVEEPDQKRQTDGRECYKRNNKVIIIRLAVCLSTDPSIRS
jgi:hypothetical protein